MGDRLFNDEIQYGGAVKLHGLRTPWFALEWFTVRGSESSAGEGQGVLSRMCTPGWSGLLAAIRGPSLTHRLNAGKVTASPTPLVQRIRRHQFLALTPSAPSVLFIAMRAGRRGARYQAQEVLGDQAASVKIEEGVVRNRMIEPPIEVVHEE